MAYKRKYERGERIKTLDEFSRCDFVWVRGKVYHNGWACPVGADIYYKVVFTEFNEQCNACTEYIGFMADNIHDDEYSIQYLVCAYGAEVVGNVYDNPELLEVKR